MGTGRPLSSLVAGTLTASAVFAGRGRLSICCAAGIAMTLLAMFGFAVNDIFDYRKDRGAGVQRPIAIGTISRHAAARFAAVLLLLAGLSAEFAGRGRIVFLATAVGLLLYSPVAQRWPLSKDLFVAGLCCAPLYYGARIAGLPFHWPPYAVLACFVLGREILMDSDELLGDRKSGMRTVAAVFGSGATRRTGEGLMLLAAAALEVVVRGAFVTIASAATLLSLVYLFAWPGLDGSRRIQLSRLPMLVGSIALAWGIG